jgi:putative SbcD/Mre11-related phosphoesterase
MLQLRPGLYADASGALWIESVRAVVIADLHLGYGWAQRRRGELGPVADDKAAAKLLSIVEELQPRTAVLAGDVVHASRPGKRERALIEDTLSKLAERAELVLVRGNHDRAFARDFASLRLGSADEWRHEDLVVLHGDRAPAQLPETGTIVLGHLHPAAIVVDTAGVARKIPVFLVSERLLILPAFSPFAGGMERHELPPEIDRLRRGPCSMIAATGRVVVPIGPLKAKLRV